MMKSALKSKGERYADTVSDNQKDKKDKKKQMATKRVTLSLTENRDNNKELDNFKTLKKHHEQEIERTEMVL